MMLSKSVLLRTDGWEHSNRRPGEAPFNWISEKGLRSEGTFLHLVSGWPIWYWWHCLVLDLEKHPFHLVQSDTSLSLLLMCKGGGDIRETNLPSAPFPRLGFLRGWGSLWKRLEGTCMICWIIKWYYFLRVPGPMVIATALYHRSTFWKHLQFTANVGTPRIFLPSTQL